MKITILGYIIWRSKNWINTRTSDYSMGRRISIIQQSQIAWSENTY